MDILLTCLRMDAHESSPLTVSFECPQFDFGFMVDKCDVSEDDGRVGIQMKQKSGISYVNCRQVRALCIAPSGLCDHEQTTPKYTFNIDEVTTCYLKIFLEMLVILVVRILLSVLFQCRASSLAISLFAAQTRKSFHSVHTTHNKIGMRNNRA